TGAGSSLFDSLLPILRSASPLRGLLSFFMPLLRDRGNLLFGVLEGQLISTFIAGAENSSWLIELARIKLDIAIALYSMTVILATILFLVFGSRGQVRPLIALILTTVGIFLQILVTPSAEGPHHSLAVYPFPQITL